ncbi:hypothetical protein Pla110_14930 [Polystyrenella longa]|uniref:Uncharacterized protein n=1 Tax=Polystyrenella longa TaxID=2528007 RepID=A0A518CKM7_9PLAN|nr:hypothetical protein Pla110_14930 [Polystyrenella longa]
MSEKGEGMEPFLPIMGITGVLHCETGGPFIMLADFDSSGMDFCCSTPARHFFRAFPSCILSIEGKP